MQITITRIENGYNVVVMGLANRQGQPLIMFQPTWAAVMDMVNEYAPEDEPNISIKE